MLALHVVAGLLVIVAGTVALFAAKGASLHRRSGMIFVYAMLFLAASGALLAVIRSQRMNLIAGVLTFYLVFTAVWTVRRRASGVHWLDLAAVAVGLAGALAGLSFGIDASRSPTGKIGGMTAGPGFVFGIVSLLAAAGDVRMMRAGGLSGVPRLRRHLWRMCAGMFIAAGSFFLGQAQVFPVAVRRSGVLAVPVLLVLVVMSYWLVRVRVTQWNRHAINA